MRIELGEARLLELVKRQLGSLFFFDEAPDGAALAQALAPSLERVERCFAPAPSKYYRREGEVYFSPFHSGQYCIFLYFLANTVAAAGPQNRILADRLYYLNKALNSVDLFYEVRLPQVFFTDHPVGTVIGRATFGEYFSFTQNCTVGNNKGVFPRFGRNVAMMAGATVVGDCAIGDNVVISAQAYVKDTDIPDCSIVFGTSPALTIKRMEESYFSTLRPA